MRKQIPNDEIERYARWLTNLCVLYRQAQRDKAAQSSNAFALGAPLNFKSSSFLEYEKRIEQYGVALDGDDAFDVARLSIRELGWRIYAEYGREGMTQVHSALHAQPDPDRLVAWRAVDAAWGTDPGIDGWIK